MASSSFVILFLLAIVVFVAFVASLILVWEARRNLRRVKQPDDPIKQAISQLSTAFWIGFISIAAGLVIGVVALLLIEFWIELLLISVVRILLALGLLLIVGGLTLAVGIYAAMAAANIRSSTKYNADPPDNNLTTAYRDSIIAAVVAIATVGLLVIGTVIWLIVSAVAARKRKEKQKLYIQSQAKLTALKLESQLKLANAQAEAVRTGTAPAPVVVKAPVAVAST